MDTQNWFGASYLGFCQEVANRYVAEQQLQQQQQPQMDDQQVDAEVEMEGQQQEQEPGQHQQEEGNNLHAQDFYDEDELIDEEGGEAVQAPPARTYPTGIDRSMAVVEFNPREGNYGSSFVTGFTSSSGDEEATDLEGIQVREVVTVGRNDLEAPDAIETAETVIDSNGMLNDQIGTNAARIHRSVPGLTNFPAIYETPQTLYWKYSNEDNGAWRLLANIAITVTVRDDSREGDRYRDLTVVTTYNGESVEQKYIGPRVRR